MEGVGGGRIEKGKEKEVRIGKMKVEGTRGRGRGLSRLGGKPQAKTSSP